MLGFVLQSQGRREEHPSCAWQAAACSRHSLPSGMVALLPPQLKCHHCMCRDTSCEVPRMHNWCLRCSREWNRDSASPQITGRPQSNGCTSVRIHKYTQRCIQAHRQTEQLIMGHAGSRGVMPVTFHVLCEPNKNQDETGWRSRKMGKKKSKQSEAVKQFEAHSFSLQLKNPACIQN